MKFHILCSYLPNFLQPPSLFLPWLIHRCCWRRFGPVIMFVLGFRRALPPNLSSIRPISSKMSVSFDLSLFSLIHQCSTSARSELYRCSHCKATISLYNPSISFSKFTKLCFIPHMHGNKMHVAIHCVWS